MARLARARDVPARFTLAVLAVMAGLIAFEGAEQAARVSDLEQRVNKKSTSEAPAPSPMMASDAEHELGAIGRDALRLWGEWDGMSPMITQMMAQTRAPPHSSLAAARHGARGRDERKNAPERAASFAVPVNTHTGMDAEGTSTQAGKDRLHEHGARGALLTQHSNIEDAPFPYVHAVMSLHGVSHAVLPTIFDRVSPCCCAVLRNDSFQRQLDHENDLPASVGLGY